MDLTQHGTARALVLLALAIAAISCASTRKDVRTFPGPGCPSGWSFLYQDQMSRHVMCRQDTTIVVSGIEAPKQAAAQRADESAQGH